MDVLSLRKIFSEARNTAFKEILPELIFYFIDDKYVVEKMNN